MPTMRTALSHQRSPCSLLLLRLGVLGGPQRRVLALLLLVETLAELLDFTPLVIANI